MGEFFRDRNQPQTLNLNSQLKELTLYEANIETHRLGKEAMNRLEGDPYLPGLIFVEEGQFLGMISRQSFFEWMSRPYSLELFTKRPLKRFYDYNQGEYLVCSGEDSIAKTVTLALQRASHLVYEPILVELQPNYYRLLSVHDLLIAHAKIHELATQKLQKSEAVLRERSEGLTKALKKLKTAQMQLIQSEKMSALGQMVAGLAHEINNPVSFIYGNIQHAQGYAQDLINLLLLYQSHYPQPVAEIEETIEELDLDFLLDDFTKVLESMKLGASRIREIIASLRNFSRLDEAQIKEVDIHDGIDSTLLILQNRLKPKPVRPAIEVVKNYGDLPVIGCYAGQLNQVFMNLLSNAIDAIEEKFEREKNAAFQPQIRIETRLSDSNNVEIRIIDNGMGIRDEDRTKLFSPFFTTKEIGKGTGLGLSISYSIIVEKHQGSLECISEEGQGTEFRLNIPRFQSLINSE
ncbi:MAG: GHKL domain-containing protein [Cyanobacteria bacterium SBLK]|nr:GHKL domain-containing protein [Cyanobacteria bacterium SBLK]